MEEVRNEFVPSDINMFESPPLLLSVKEMENVEFSSINSTETSNFIQFHIPGSSNKYLNLDNMNLKLELQLLKSDGTTYVAADADQPYFESNILSNMFTSATVQLNGQTVRTIDNFALNQWITNKLSFSKSYAESVLYSAGFIPDGDKAKLKKFSANSKEFEVYGKLNLINTSKLLIPNVACNIKLILNSANNYLIEDTTKTKSKVKISSATLFADLITLKDEVQFDHEKILNRGIKATYNYAKSDVIVANISKSSKSIEINNIFTSNQTPKFLICGYLSHKAISGDRSERKYEFKPLSLTNFAFVVNSRVLPQNHFRLNATDKKYATVFAQSMNALKLKHGNSIDCEKFIEDQFLLCYDLSSYGIGLSEIDEEDRGGVNIGVRMLFSKELEENISLVLMTISNGRFDIDVNRAVTLVK